MDDPAEFERCWPLLQAAIEQDIGGAVYSKEEIWGAIDKCEAHLWTTAHAACIAEVIDRLDGRYLNIFAVGSERGYLVAEVMKVIWPKVEEWARANNCLAITASGRASWVRICTKHGFTPVLTMFKKEL